MTKPSKEILAAAQQTLLFAFPLLGNPYFTAEHKTTIMAKAKINAVLAEIAKVVD